MKIFIFSHYKFFTNWNLAPPGEKFGPPRWKEHEKKIAWKTPRNGQNATFWRFGPSRKEKVSICTPPPPVVRSRGGEKVSSRERRHSHKVALKAWPPLLFLGLRPHKKLTLGAAGRLLDARGSWEPRSATPAIGWWNDVKYPQYRRLCTCNNYVRL